jgi:hypothetical protein
VEILKGFLENISSNNSGHGTDSGMCIKSEDKYYESYSQIWKHFPVTETGSEQKHLQRRMTDHSNTNVALVLEK